MKYWLIACTWSSVWSEGEILHHANEVWEGELIDYYRRRLSMRPIMKEFTILWAREIDAEEYKRWETFL